MWKYTQFHASFLLKSGIIATALHYTGLFSTSISSASIYMGWPVFGTAMVFSGTIVCAAEILKKSAFKNLFNRLKNFINRAKVNTLDQQPIEQVQEDPEQALQGDLMQGREELPSMKDQLIRQLESNNDIDDAIRNEALLHIQADHHFLGEQQFNLKYQDGLETVLIEVTQFFPHATDSAAAAIGRLLELDDTAIASLNTPDKSYEDERINSAAALNRHQNAFHAKFFWIDNFQANTRQNMRNYAQHEWNQICAKNNDPLIRGIELFKFIYKIQYNFEDSVNFANSYNAQIQLDNLLQPPQDIEPLDEPADSIPQMSLPMQEMQAAAPKPAQTIEERRRLLAEAAERRMKLH